MRVAMVTPYPSAPDMIAGGVEAVAYNLVEALHRQGQVHVDVVAPTPRVMMTGEQRPHGNVYWLKQSPLAFLGYWSEFRARLHRLLRQLRPDVVHFQGLAGWALGYDGPAVITIHGIPELDTRHAGGAGNELRARIVHAIERRARARSDDKVIISPYVEQQLATQLGGKLWRIENPVHQDFFAVERCPEPRRLLYVGRINARKNVSGLIRAFAAATPCADARLRIAGKADDPAYLACCQQTARELGIESKVQWIGNLDRQKLLAELRIATALILVSQQETAPMVLAEAMAAAVPVIASNVCGNPHLVVESQTGWLVDPHDTAQIAARIATVLAEDRTVAEMSLRSRCVARERFDPDSVARRTREVYEHALIRGARAA